MPHAACVKILNNYEEQIESIYNKRRNVNPEILLADDGEFVSKPPQKRTTSAASAPFPTDEDVFEVADFSEDPGLDIGSSQPLTLSDGGVDRNEKRPSSKGVVEKGNGTPASQRRLC